MMFSQQRDTAYDQILPHERLFPPDLKAKRGAEQMFVRASPSGRVIMSKYFQRISAFASFHRTRIVLSPQQISERI